MTEPLSVRDAPAQGSPIGAASPDVSLVMIAFREAGRIGGAVRAVLAQEGVTTLELIVVDDGSDDGTATAALAAGAGDERLRLVRLPANRGRGAARAAGLTAARAPIVGFVDADITLPFDWLARCLAALPGHAAVSGVAVPDGDAAVVARLSGARPRVVPGSMPITGNNVLFDGAVLRAVGFPESRLGEDFRVAARLLAQGHRLATAAGLTVSHAEGKGYLASLRWLYASGIDATLLLGEFRRVRQPDVAWAGWLGAWLLALSSLPALGPVALGIGIAASVGVTLAHAASRFAARPIRAFVRAALLDMPGVLAYLIGRTVGGAVLIARALRGLPVTARGSATQGRRLLRDPLARGAVNLAAATVSAGAFGFLFWMLAARTQPPAAVGAASAFAALLGLVAAIAGLGLPETIVRHLPWTGDPRAMVVAAARPMLAAGLVGGLLLGLAPSGAPIDASPAVRAVVGLISAPPLLAWALGGAALLAARRSVVLVGGSLATGVTKVAAVVALAAAGIVGAVPLVLALAGGAVAGAIVTTAATALHYRAAASPPRAVPGSDGTSLAPGQSWRSLRGYAGANLVAGVASLAPLAVAPWLIAARAGPEAAAYAALPLMLLALLNLPAATISRSYFAEASRSPNEARRLASRSLALASALTVAIGAATFVAAPAILGLLGGRYAEEGTGLLRLLAVASLIAMPSYLADALLNVRRDRVGYAIANVGGAGWIVLCLLVAASDPISLGIAWIAGQAGYLVLAWSLVARGSDLPVPAFRGGVA